MRVIKTVGSKVVVSLDNARNELVSGLGKIGDLQTMYATALDQAFDLKDSKGNITTKWFDLQGALRKGVKAERANFVAAMEKAGYSKPTIDVNWQRVKEKAGYVTNGNRVKGTMDIDAKTVAELKTMLNRIYNDETESKSQQIKPLLIQAYEALGGDSMDLGK
tara:strand:+ start:13929 stop:14417 length:489 start_codon:yes stop_codon:yes gene_type:complete